LLSRLALTPLERIVHVLKEYAPQEVARIVSAYGDGLMLLQEPAVRQELIASTAPESATLPPVFVRIIELGGVIRTALRESLSVRCRSEPQQLLPF